MDDEAAPRHAEAAIAVLVAVAAGRPCLHDVRWEMRDAAADLVREATGATTRDGVAVVAGRAIADVRDATRDGRREVAGRMDDWMRRHGAVDPALAAGEAAMGLDRIIEAMGFSPARALALAAAIRGTTLRSGARRLLLRGRDGGVTGQYRADAVTWEAGAVAIRGVALPRQAAVALAGEPLSVLVDDEALAHETIRHVPWERSRDGRQHLTTTSAGRMAQGPHGRDAPGGGQ